VITCKIHDVVERGSILLGMQYFLRESGEIIEQTSAREVNMALTSIRELWQDFDCDPEDNM